MENDVKQFCNDFDIVDNALDMRTLARWNGRNLRKHENLAEHTHLVVACVIKLYDYFKIYIKFNFEGIIRLAMLHDSLELLRGDILSITKDSIPGLRELTDIEEQQFLSSQFDFNDLNAQDWQLVKLADLMACYKFIEDELKYPSNNFAIEAYKYGKQKYEDKLKEFCITYDIDYDFYYEHIVTDRLVKGYVNDAGNDVLLENDVTFMPMQTTVIDLNLVVVPNKGEMGFLCSRTSAAAKGLIVAMCPIDPDFNGTITAVVHNMSNSIITYHKGEAFCQIVKTPINYIDGVKVKKEGKRSNGKLGSTGNV